MDQVIHGVNSSNKVFLLSNYSLTYQIVIINCFTACLSLIFLIIFNFFLLNSEKNINNQKKIILEKLDQTIDYLSHNAIKRILTFDDTCNRVSKESNLNCIQNNFLDKNYKDKTPQLDPTYTQQYIYSNFSNSSLNVKVIADNLINFADTDDVYGGKSEVIILDIDVVETHKSIQNQSFYKLYQSKYFDIYNFIKKILDKKKLNNQNLQKIKNDNIIAMEVIKKKNIISYTYKDTENNFKTIFSGPILKENKVYGVVLLNSQIFFEDYEGGSQSILLTNFFLFFISIMFFFSFLFLKSIVIPIKTLSSNTKLERDKLFNKKNIIDYPVRKDEIGTLSEDIKSMSSDLKKRIIEIEEFASDVSHELKNPVAGLKSSNELLKTKKLTSKKENLLIKNMGVDIDRMNILISDISNYSLTQVEISEEFFEEIDIINFFNNLKDSLPKSHYTLDIQCCEKEIFLKINKDKFLQVIHSLLDNALTFIPNDSNILIHIKSNKKSCIIHFADQGFGIPLNYKDKIFQRFYTDREFNRNSHSGLGLSITKKIIESFEGTITLIKSPYFSFQGACFEIKLPLKDL